MTTERLPSTYLRHGFKTGVATLLSWEATRLLGLPYGYWAVISTVVVMQVYVADSVHMCLYRFFGTTLGAIIGILAMWAFPEEPLWNDIGIFTTLGFCAFMTRFSPRYRMAAITVAVVYVGSFGTPVEDRVLYALWRLVEITMGVLSAFLVSVFVLPDRLEAQLSQRIGKQSREAARLCWTLTEVFVHGNPAPPFAALQELDVAIHGNRQSLSGITHHELLFSKKKRGKTLQSTIVLLERIAIHLSVMGHSLANESVLNQKFILSDELLVLGHACADRIALLGEKSPEPMVDTLSPALHACKTRLLALRKEGVSTRLDLDTLAGFYEFFSALKALSEEVLAHGQP